MPWLVVTGDGSWTLRHEGQTCRFKAGKHEVSESLAAYAREHAPNFVVVTPTEPVLAHSPSDGPLSPDDIRLGTGIGVSIVEAPVLTEPEPDPDAPPLDHGCPWCPEKFPSPAAVKLHIECEHTVRHERTHEEREAMREAERLAEEERQRIERVAREAPEVVHPFERPEDAPVPEGSIDLTPS